MARRKWVIDHFGERLREERDRRGWSQEALADMLVARGVPMHWTSVGKIEKGTRSVRLDEAVEIAALFGTSIDALIGRQSGDDLAFALRVLLDSIRQAMQQISETTGTLHSRVSELDRFDFDGREQLQGGILQATAGLMQALSALVSLSVFDLPPEAASVAALKAAVDLEGSQTLHDTLAEVEDR